MPPSGRHHVVRREGFMTTPHGRVMFIAAHPDDPDFLAGGTVARLAKEGREDGELEDTRDLRRDVTREMRRWRPDLIITLSPHRTHNDFPGWHRDHRITGRVVLDCVYPLARDHLAFPELPREYEPHGVRELYCIQ
mgnify:CR=1 FL=1